MEDSKLSKGRKLVQGMRNLEKAIAPATLLPGVLVQTGLADGYWTLETPIGLVYVAYNNEGISTVMRAKANNDFEEAFTDRFGRQVYPISNPPTELNRAVTLQLSGKKQPNLRFDLRGLSEFERAVLLKALEIPTGEVRPYSWIAQEIGRAKAVRAVGSALGRNPIPLLIPCHRVIRSDGRIGDYALGAANKRIILEAEGAEPQTLEQLGSRGVRYFGSDTTHIYCFPTCRNARRITEPHRVSFGSETAASQAGYRPCKVCRPA